MSSPPDEPHFFQVACNVRKNFLKSRDFTNFYQLREGGLRKISEL